MANAKITKNALAAAMIKIGESKDIDKITVAEIVEECGVNRQTFYYHFEDKYELLVWIYQSRIFDDIQNGLNFENWEEKMIKALKEVSSIKSFAVNTIKSSNNILSSYMQEVLTKIFKLALDEITDLDRNEISATDEEMYARFLTYGLSGIITDWLLDKFEASEEELVRKIKVMFIRTERIDIQHLLLNEK